MLWTVQVVSPQFWRETCHKFYLKDAPRGWMRWKNTWLLRAELMNTQRLLREFRSQTPSAMWTQTGQTHTHRQGSVTVSYFVGRKIQHFLDSIRSDKFPAKDLRSLKYSYYHRTSHRTSLITQTPRISLYSRTMVSGPFTEEITLESGRDRRFSLRYHRHPTSSRAGWKPKRLGTRRGGRMGNRKDSWQEMYKGGPRIQGAFDTMNISPCIVVPSSVIFETAIVFPGETLFQFSHSPNKGLPLCSRCFPSHFATSL